MLLLLTLAGMAVRFTLDSRTASPRLRRRAGAALLALIVLVILAFAGALAHSQRGFTGIDLPRRQRPHQPQRQTPPNTPGRLTAVASVRARYWKEALQVWEAHPASEPAPKAMRPPICATARRPSRSGTPTASSCRPSPTSAWSGTLLALALLLAWMVAAGRATHPLNRRWSAWSSWLGGDDGERPGWRAHPQPYTPERIGMLTLLCLVVVFGVHSLVDWTWYVPGDACVALICAGWLAARGPLPSRAGGLAAAGPAVGVAGPPQDERRGAAGPLVRVGALRGALAGAAILAALLAGLDASGSPSAPKKPASKPSPCSAGPGGGHGRRPRRRRPRPALGQRPVRLWPTCRAPPGTRDGADDARASGSPAALQPGDLARTRSLRPGRPPARRPLGAAGRRST